MTNLLISHATRPFISMTSDAVAYPIRRRTLLRHLSSSICRSDLFFFSCVFKALISLAIYKHTFNFSHAIERRTVNQEEGGSIPPTVVSKLRQFHSSYICLCLSEETLKASGPFYLVFMPGEVKDPTQGVNV